MLPQTLSRSLSEGMRLNPKQARRANQRLDYHKQNDGRLQKSPTIKFCADLFPGHRYPSGDKVLKMVRTRERKLIKPFNSKAYFPANKMNC